jgi:cytochrome c oxidase subunit I+III
VFGLMFAGFHLAFFPMHIAGLAGMPRRVHTYPAGLGWDGLNLASTAGAFLIAAGVALFVVDVARRFRLSFEANAGNVWNAGTLEWLPSGNYSARSIPIVASREPLWDQPGLARDVEAGRYYLPGAPTGRRETIVSSPVEAAPQFVMRMPAPGWPPVIAAWFTAAFFLLLTVKWVVPAFACGAIALGAMLAWAWQLDPPPLAAPIDIGGGLRLPAYASGPDAHSWWAMVVLMLVAGAMYGCVVFAYLYLWTVAPETWPTADRLQPLGAFAVPAALLAASSAAIGIANRALARGRSVSPAVAAAIVFIAAAFAADVYGHRELVPTTSGYGAVVYLVLALAGFYAAAAIVLALFAAARQARGLADRVRRVTFDNARLFWHYTVAQGLAGLAVVHGFPRLVA